MPGRVPQTYATHAYRPVMSLLAALFAFAAFGLFAVDAVLAPSWLSAAWLLLSLAVILLVSISRVYILRLQDRIIRLEMQLRLARLGREADFARLSTRQLVALRFAPDAELPGLIDRALSDRLSSRQIKEAITDWQSDYHRT